MQRVSIETTQNVDIDYRLASVGDRIVAFILDAIIIGCYAIFMIIIFAAALGDVLAGSEGVLITLAVLFAAPYVFYHLACEVFMNGQSIGKRAMDIKVVRLDGRQPTIGQYVIRYLFRIIDVLFYGIVAILCIVMGEKGQRLGDMLAGTTVIKLTKKEKISNSSMAQIARQDDYEPVYPQATELRDKDVRLIEEVLKVSMKTGNREPVFILTKKIKDKLNIEFEGTPEHLLRTLAKDHAYYTSL